MKKILVAIKFLALIIFPVFILTACFSAGVLKKPAINNEMNNSKPGAKATTTFDDAVVNEGEGADSCYFKKDSNIFFNQKYPDSKNADWVKIKDVDFGSFEIVACSYLYGYAKDNKNIYWGNQKITGADLSSFEILNGYYSKDYKNIYAGAWKMEEADYKTFSVIIDEYQQGSTVTKYDWAKDKNQVYHFEKIAPNLDPATYKIFGAYSLDKDAAYYRDEKIDNADAKSFKIIRGEESDAGLVCAYDQNNFYLNGRDFPASNLKYFADKDIYTNGKETFNSNCEDKNYLTFDLDSAIKLKIVEISKKDKEEIEAMLPAAEYEKKDYYAIDFNKDGIKEYVLSFEEKINDYIAPNLLIFKKNNEGRWEKKYEYCGPNYRCGGIDSFESFMTVPFKNNKNKAALKVIGSMGRGLGEVSLIVMENDSIVDTNPYFLDNKKLFVPFLKEGEELEPTDAYGYETICKKDQNVYGVYPKNCMDSLKYDIGYSHGEVFVIKNSIKRIND